MSIKNKCSSKKLKKNKKVLLVALVSTMALMLNGCGNKEQIEEIADLQAKIEQLESEMSEIKQILVIEKIDNSKEKVNEDLEQENTDDFQEIKSEILENNEDEDYYLVNLKLMTTSDEEGNVKYYYAREIDYDVLNIASLNSRTTYCAITDSNKIFTRDYYRYDVDSVVVYNSIGNISLTKHYWIPDSSVSFMFDAEYFPLPDGYTITEKYSKEDIQNIQDIINSPDYNPYEYLKSAEFSIDKLYICGTGDYLGVFNTGLYAPVYENLSPDDVNTLRTVLYFYDILNMKNGMKYSYGLNTIEEKVLRDKGDNSYTNNIYFEEFTSLNVLTNQELKNKNRYTIDIFPYLTEEQIKLGKISYDEIVEIVAEIKKEMGIGEPSLN